MVDLGKNELISAKILLSSEDELESDRSSADTVSNWSSCVTEECCVSRLITDTGTDIVDVQLTFLLKMYILPFTTQTK